MNHQRRRIVTAGSQHGGIHQALSGIHLWSNGRGGSQQIEQGAVVKPVCQSIRAEQENVTRLAAHRADLRIDKLVVSSQRLLQNIAARMRPRLAFVQLSVAEQPADISIVFAELLDASSARAGR